MCGHDVACTHTGERRVQHLVRRLRARRREQEPSQQDEPHRGDVPEQHEEHTEADERVADPPSGARGDDRRVRPVTRPTPDGGVQQPTAVEGRTGEQVEPREDGVEHSEPSQERDDQLRSVDRRDQRRERSEGDARGPGS